MAGLHVAEALVLEIEVKQPGGSAPSGDQVGAALVEEAGFGVAARLDHGFAFQFLESRVKARCFLCREEANGAGLGNFGIGSQRHLFLADSFERFLKNVASVAHYHE